MRRLFAALVVPPGAALVLAQVVFAAAPTASFTISDTTPNVGQPVTFDASGSTDPDGDIKTYEWDLGFDGSFNPTETGAVVSHTYTSAGPRSVALRVTDDVTTDGTVESDVSAPATPQLQVNAPPVADARILNAQAEPGQRIDTPLVGQPFTLTGSGSSDPDGGALSYAWDLNNDGTFERPGQDAAVAGIATAGERTVKLRVTDPNQATSVATLTFRVNSAPVPAFIYEPLTPVVNQPIQFSSISSDPDTPEALTYSWDLDGDGAFGETTPLERGPNPSHVFATPGQKTVTMRVTDTGGVTRELSRTITLQLSVPNGAFTASADAPLPGEPVSFNSTSSASAGKQITSTEWDFDYDIATGNFTPDATGASATHAFESAGPKRVAIRVAEGPAGGFDIETLVVVVNALPQADFTVVPASPFAGDVVTISSTSSDPDGPLTRQEWDLDADGAFDDAAGALAQATFRRARAYRVHLRVTDSKGATSTVSRDVKVRRRPLSLLSGVLIQMRGRLVGASTSVIRLAVRAPRGARVTVRCLSPVKSASTGAGCPRRVVRTSKGRTLRFRTMEGRLAPATKIIVAITRTGFLGRYTVFRMRARREPLRRDRCIAPGAQRATRCPRS